MINNKEVGFERFLSWVLRHNSLVIIFFIPLLIYFTIVIIPKLIILYIKDLISDY